MTRLLGQLTGKDSGEAYKRRGRKRLGQSPKGDVRAIFEAIDQNAEGTVNQHNMRVRAGSNGVAFGVISKNVDDSFTFSLSVGQMNVTMFEVRWGGRGRLVDHLALCVLAFKD